MKKTFALILCMMLLAGMVTGCSSSSSSSSSKSTGASAGSYKEEVVVGVQAQITTMDPQSAADVAHNQIFKLTHDTLVGMDITNGKILPELAESWNWVNDTTIEFKLRKDAKFHNGEPVKASDVVYTFKRGREGKASGSKMAPAKEVVAVDDYTVRMTLSSPNMDWMDALSLPVFSILSEKALTDDPKSGYQIGSGPWKLNKFVNNDYIALDNFDGYWAGAMPTKKLKIRYIPESSARVIAVQTGEIDLCLAPDPAEVPNIEKDKNLSLIKYDSSTCQFFGFNFSKAPGNNKLLRQAIAHAINRDDIIAATENGYGTPAKTYWGSAQFGYYDGFKGYDYDINKAKQMVKDAGYPNGVDLEVTVISGKRVATAEIIQAELKEIGVNVKINEVDSAALTSITNAGTHQAFVYGLSFNTAGDDVRRVYGDKSSTNRSKYHNDQVNKLMDLALAEPNPDKRKEYYKELQVIANDDTPIIPLYYEVNFAAANKNLGGITWCNTSNIDMSGVYVKK